MFVSKVKPVTQTHQYESYTTANRYHFYHTMGLFTAQFSSYPLLTAGLFGVGMLMFCSAAYMEGLTELPDLEGASWAEYMKRTKDEHKFVFLMPVGGTCFMLGWLSHIL